MIVVGCNVGSSGGLEANLPLSLCKLAQYGGYLIRRARLRGVRRKRDCAEVQVGLSTRLGSYVGPSLLATL